MLEVFDGRTWSQLSSTIARPAPLVPQGPAYKYTVMMEPHQHRWLFMLDWPDSWKLRSITSGASEPSQETCDGHAARRPGANSRRHHGPRQMLEAAEPGSNRAS